jgi:hypothetical protein
MPSRFWGASGNALLPSKAYRSVGGVWTPASLGSRLIGWYEADPATLYKDTSGTTLVSADGDHVIRINDKSGNGNHLIDTATNLGQLVYHTGTNPKVTSSPGTGDVKLTTSSSTITVADGNGQHAIGFAGKFAGTSGFQNLVSLSDGGTNNMGFLWTSSTTPQMVAAFSGGTFSDNCAAIDTTQPHVLTGRITFAAGTASSEAYNDGVSDGASTHGSALNGVTVPISLFDTPGQGNQFGGDFYAAVVVSGTLTDPEHASLVTYLGNRCGRSL